MTLPINNILPMRTDFKSVEDVDRYIRDLVFALQQRDEQVVSVVNGDIRGNAFTQRQNWKPVLKGSVTPGTFTYTQQIGWVLRQGTITDVWFDVAWSSAGAAAGNLYVELPYKVALSDQMPFVGVCQPSDIDYGAGHTDIVVNAIPSSYRGEFWVTGSTATTANLGVAASGRLIGHVRYIGVQNESA
jgi:hypothetical protein